MKRPALKRILKYTLVSCCLLVALPVVAVVAMAGWYQSIVRQEPGGLPAAVGPGELGKEVNTFSGTGGIPYVCAHNTPAATTPFGMVRLGPDTASILVNRIGLNRSGYYYGDNKITGFSHTRFVGTDHEDGGHFQVFPTTASRAPKARRGEFFARFSHREETAHPGYYAVRLPKEGVLAELTATARVGVHRYTFDRGETPHVLLDVTSHFGDRRREDGLLIVSPETQEIEGSVRTFGSASGRYGGLEVYFVARFDRPFAEFGVWSGETFILGADAAAGSNIGFDASFEAQGGKQVVELRLALSYVSIQNARLNLDAEAAGRSFEDVATAAQDAWETRLSSIRVQGGTARQRRIFYTGLYRSFQMPTLFSDTNGEYRGFDKAVHQTEGFRYFTDFSLWDTFRTVHPLYNLIAREDQRDMMVSLVEMAKAGGYLPRWAAGCGYTNSMLGTPADIAITEAYLKGIRDFDVETAYEAMRRTATGSVPRESGFSGRRGIRSYLDLGYCASDAMSKAVSRTLEYAWADHAVSLLAKELGHEQDALLFARHAQFYRNLWNPETQYFQPKDSQGQFFKDFRPKLLSYADFGGKYTDDYVEGSALQWRWCVPHDAEGLLSLFESKDYFVRELDAFFAENDVELGAWNPGVYYWHGNEPDLNAAYLFNAAGRPDLTQKWVRWILDTRYDDTYVGLDGNDDAGTLSAWYVLSALGFYPIAGTTRYELGAPLFERAEVRIGSHVLTIIAENYAPENCYATQVWLNGNALNRTNFDHREIADGGTLRFQMAPEPPRSWSAEKP